MKTELEKARRQLDIADVACIVIFAALFFFLGIDMYFPVFPINYISVCLFPAGIFFALKQLSHGRLSAAGMSVANYKEKLIKAQEKLKVTGFFLVLSVVIFIIVCILWFGQDPATKNGRNMLFFVACFFASICCMVADESLWTVFWLKRTGKVQPEGENAITQDRWNRWIKEPEVDNGK